MKPAPDPKSVLPSHESQECLANPFVTFTQTKSSRLGTHFLALTLSHYLLLQTYLNLTSLKQFLMEKFTSQL